MGTTGTAIVTDSAVKLEFVVAIEGVEYLLTTGSSTAAVTAWSGTEWSSAVSGLQIDWSGNTQEIEPFGEDAIVTHVSFGVMDTSATRADTIGVMVGRVGGGNETFLNEDLDVSETGVNGLDLTSFDASGTIHIGTEAIDYASIVSTTFTTCTRGRRAPFGTNSGTANRFGRHHPLPSVTAGYVLKPKISSVQRTWKGRWVGIWAHRDVAGTWDTKAQAQLLWAGRIDSTRDEASGMTWFECESATSAIRDCVLMRDQWTARVQEGITLAAGFRFKASDAIASSVKNANDLVVVASGASGSNEMNAGRWELADLLSTYNQWLAAEKVATRLGMSWSFEHVDSGESTRVQIRLSGGTTTGTNIIDFNAPARVLEFLGFTAQGYGNGQDVGINAVWEDVASRTVVGPEEPYRTFVQPWEDESIVEVDNEGGTYISNAGFFTPDQQALAALVTGTPGVVQVGDNGPLYVCGYAAGELDLRQDSSWYNPFGFVRLPNARWSEGEIAIRQVGILYGQFDTVLTSILASTGTAAYNHATYDQLPAQLGAAIPYEILGARWLTRVQTVSAGTGDVMIVVEEPTPLMEAIGVDLAVRFCAIGWKGAGSGSVNAGITLLGWGTPSSALSVYALTESNKARPIDAQDNLVTPANDTSQRLCNSIVLKYNRRLGTDDYASTISIRDPASQYDHGTGKSITIKLRNTYDGVDGTTGWLPTLVESLTAAMGLFSKPRRVLKRTIDQQAFDGIAPGDTVTISDDFARDPTTGARQITSKAALILSHRAEWGGWENDSQGMAGQAGDVELMILPQDRIYAYSPTAEVSSYNAGTKVVTCVANRHSETSDTVTADAPRFPAGSKVRWVEIDPDTAAAPATGVDTVASQTGNTITLTTGGALTSNMRIISDDYSTATAAQQANTYVADDDDNLVQNVLAAYQYGYDVNNATTGTAITDWSTFRYHNTLMYTQGEPLDTGSESDAVRNVNCLIDHRTAPSMGQLYRATIADNTPPSAFVRRIGSVEPFFVGPGLQNGIYRRYLYIRPWLRSSTGGALTMWVSLCARRPQGSSYYTTDADAPAYTLGGPYVRKSWSVSSTTWGVGSMQAFDTRGIGDEDGICYLVTEFEEDLETRGLAMCHLGVRSTS